MGSLYPKLAFAGANLELICRSTVTNGLPLLILFWSQVDLHNQVVIIGVLEPVEIFPAQLALV